MSIVAVGTIGLDTIETPFGRAEEALGGSAAYFALAASFYSEVGIVSVVGEDFPGEHSELLQSRGIDLGSVQRLPGQTFRWGGRYDYDLNTRDTLFTHLNVLTEFRPQLPAAQRAAPFVFLANIDPTLQLAVLDQAERPRLTMLDTMNFWIESDRDGLTEALRRVDAVVINEEELREYVGEPSTLKAARAIRALGPRIVIVKRGEYGAVLFADERYFYVPAYPLEEVRDPTGAGDSFAGGFMGYLARTGNLSPANVRRALVHGSVVASFTVEQFGVQSLVDLSLPQIEARFQEFRLLTHFDEGDD